MSTIKLVVSVAQGLASDLRAAAAKPSPECEDLHFLAFSMACDHLEEEGVTAEDVQQVRRALERRWAGIRTVEGFETARDLRPSSYLVGDLLVAMMCRRRGESIAAAYDIPF